MTEQEYFDAFEEAREIIDVGDDKINRLNDRFAKSLLTNPRNKPILIDFINDALFLEGEDVIADIEIASGELVQNYVGMKLSRLDVSATFKNGYTCDIEIQIADNRDFRKRAPFYWAMRHVLKLHEGKDYTEIKSTICICMLAFTLFREEPGYRNAYSIRNDESGSLLSDDLRIVFLELPKFLRQVKTPKTGLERWLLYFSNRGGDEMNKAAEKDPAILMAMNFENAFWANDQERENYFATQKFILDSLSIERRHERQLQEAMEQGMEQGVTREKIDIAKKMLARNMTPDVVADLSGLSLEEIAKLN